MGFAINQVVVSGNLTRSPEQRATQSGTSVTTLGIAYNERRKVNDEWVDVGHFFDATCFGKQGEWLAAHASKGDPITISGSLDQQRWKDKTTGDNRSKVCIIARDVVLGQRGNGGGQRAPESAPYETPAAATGYGEVAY